MNDSFLKKIAEEAYVDELEKIARIPFLKPIANVVGSVVANRVGSKVINKVVSKARTAAQTGPSFLKTIDRQIADAVIDFEKKNQKSTKDNVGHILSNISGTAMSSASKALGAGVGTIGTALLLKKILKDSAKKNPSNFAKSFINLDKAIGGDVGALKKSKAAIGTMVLGSGVVGGGLFSSLSNKK